MKRLTGITVDDLQNVLESVDDKKPAQRLFVAIAYKNGVTQSELAKWFDVERKTIYNWLTRLEERDFECAVLDEDRPGRPRKLTDEQLNELESVLQNPPTGSRFDAPAWTTELLQRFIRDQFNIDYSRPSCRRLMKEAGLNYQTPRKAAAEADVEDPQALEKKLKKLSHVWIPS
ncbi:IS630 family transposase [Haloprofundus halobius]|uniref:IS630 family transposase n=1 Tax=Haloprofundus halobius TaxID=2876194 RepID=UPI001CD014E8|nr:IS630 family transposase [Haloprofundus halobius]